MAVPVPRDDFRTFPVDAPLTRDEKILADARAAIEKYGTNAGRDAEVICSPLLLNSRSTTAQGVTQQVICSPLLPTTS